ncbi:hypothetical protein GTA62_07275 [Roseobacter sp. HKCCD9010]|nr:hypothetical protein [Rhodobacterales bacterium HKCCD4356]NNV10326.1 hypothetical protein [Roseobacter sp. HKCCD7357]NNV18146.1 hypothetical protein [Roseobacter sp. HKCCD8768]NNV27606.1 hypothetical protein [Roseobacter sp. HKCCD8192]NNV31872.1 hypothetical protein [Roseobacter sp. HKCCD9061]NNV36125.1 hypothetical protein [Roseobacter sp. HKCCD9073]NNV40383.1 hypothetical protein [Roseobacter sp. HKCCD9054]NNV44618.1 hypothetical protein [Roseobacter sp. HKCCD6497]NNV48917.1 hypothetic
MKETELYPPVKAYLEAQGYEVKAEVAGADVVAQRGSEGVVIVELKTRFSLALFHQGVARLAVSDVVYLAVPRQTGRVFQKALAENVKLARRLGLGLLTVRLKDGFVEAHCDPGPYAPRISKPRKARLLREFARRVGDPNTGGTRGGIVTAYRQDALNCAAYLAREGPSKGAVVKAATGVERATTIMRDDHYGWFERVETGVYALTPKGAEGLTAYKLGGADGP